MFFHLPVSCCELVSSGADDRAVVTGQTRRSQGEGGRHRHRAGDADTTSPRDSSLSDNSTTTEEEE